MSTTLRFAHISDTHIRPAAIDRSQTFIDHLAEIQAGGYDFIIHTGDLMDEPSAWAARAFGAITSGVQMPIYRVPGNHDVYNPHLGGLAAPWWARLAVDSDLEAQYRRWFGPTWYTFSYQGAHFVALDSLLINSGLPEEKAQWAWLEVTLTDIAGRQPKWIFLFTHLPLFIRQPYERLEPVDFQDRYLLIAPPGRDRLLRLIRQYRVAAVFSGHLHVPWEVAHTWPEGFTTRFISTGSSGLPSAMAVEHFDLPLSPAQGLGYHEHRLAEEGLSSRYHQHPSAPLGGRWRLEGAWMAWYPPGQAPPAGHSVAWSQLGYRPSAGEWRESAPLSPLPLVRRGAMSLYVRQTFEAEEDTAALYLELCTERAVDIYLNGELLYTLEPLVPRPSAWQGAGRTYAIDSPLLALGLNQRLVRRGENVLALWLRGQGSGGEEYIAYRELEAA